MFIEKKIILIFSLILLLSCSISFVSATDNIDVSNNYSVEDNQVNQEKSIFTDVGSISGNYEPTTSYGKKDYTAIFSVDSSYPEDNVGNISSFKEAWKNVEDGGLIVIEGSQNTTYYYITEDISTKNLKNSVNSFSLSSDNGNVVLVFSNSSLRLEDNLNIKISNIAFTTNNASIKPIINNNANLTLENCSIFSSTNTNNYGLIHNSNSLSVTSSIMNNNFVSNQGGVIYSENGKVNILNSSFTNNSAENGGVLSSINSKINVINSSFENNSASYGGVFSIRDDSKLNILESIFINNTAKFNGGVLNSYYSSSNWNNSILLNNSASYGGVLYSVNNVITNISNSLFDNNEAYFDADIAYTYRDNLTIYNSVVLGFNKLNSIYCYNTSYNLNNNWWGKNNPDFKILTNNIVPENWRIMRINKENGMDNRISASLTYLSDSTVTTEELFNRRVFFKRDDNLIDTSTISSIVISNPYSNLEEVSVTIDYQTLKLSDKLTPYMCIDDISTKINDPVTLIVKCNPDIIGNITIKVNDTFLTEVTPINGTAKVDCLFDSTWKKGNYTLTASLSNDIQYYDIEVNSTLFITDYSNNTLTLITKNKENEILEIITTVPSTYNTGTFKEYQTSIKDQGSSGSCWAFSCIAALESAYLKAYGIEYNFSENHMKNHLKKYSIIGDTNANPDTGNGELQPIAYLVGWYGPINEEDDVYNDQSIMSPLLNNSVKIEDVYFIHRSTFTGADNDELKKAIMEYGALSTCIYASYYGAASINLYYTATPYPNHAIAIVGWDDFYNDFNGRNRPAGPGAYIIKNSWGEELVGDNGYQYVSYYDTSLGGVLLEDNLFGSFSYAFPVQEYENYTKIYQHDTISDKIVFITPNAWIRNIYTAESDDCIAGVGTFVYENSDYEAYVYVNDKLSYIQNGSITQPGYRIIKLNDYIQINKGDTFKVDLKLTAHIGDWTTIAIQDTSSYKTISKANQSFISSDGVDWIDLYTSEDVPYSAACLKVYTKDTPRISSYINQTEYYQITTVINNLNASGRLSFKVDNDYYLNNGEIFYYNVMGNGTYNLTIPLRMVDKEEYNVTIILETDEFMVRENITLKNIHNETVIKENVKLTSNNFTYFVDDEQLILAQVMIENKKYNTTVNKGNVFLYDSKDMLISVANVVNGSVKFNLNQTSGNYTYKIIFTNSTWYFDDEILINLTILRHQVNIELLDISSSIANTNCIITGKITSETKMSNANLHIIIGNNGYDIQSNKEGIFVVRYFIEKSTNYPLSIVFYENSTHNQAIYEENLITYKQTTTLILNTLEMYFKESVNITGKLLDINSNPIIKATVSLYINENLINVTKTNNEGNYVFSYFVNDNSTKVILVKYDGNETFHSSENFKELQTIIHQTTISINPIQTLYYGENLTINGELRDNKGNYLNNERVRMKFDNQIFDLITTNGTFEHTTMLNKTGDVLVSLDFFGSERYESSNKTLLLFVNKQKTSLVLNNSSNIKYNDLIIINGKLEDNNGVKLNNFHLNLKINEKIISVLTNENGVFEYSYKATIVGNNNLTLTYMGDEYYEECFISKQVYVDKKDTQIIIDNIIPSKYNENIIITGKFVNSDNKALINSNLIYEINGIRNTTKTDDMGNFHLIYKVSLTGNNNFTISYKGNQKYNPTNNTTSFIVNKQDTIININNVADIKYLDIINITGIFKNANGQALINSQLKVCINGQNSTVKTDKKGIFTIEFKATTIGKNEITVSYGGNSKYNTAIAKITFIIDKKDTIITINDILGAKYGDTLTIRGTFMNADGITLKNSNVKLIINGEVQTLRTDNNGVFNCEFKASIIGENNITVSYAGNTKYNPYSVNQTFVVDKKDTKIALNILGNYSKGNTMTVSGEFTTVDGVILKNSNVVIYINGAHHTIKTDSNGLYNYTFKATKTGINNVTVGYNGNSRYNPASNSTSFTINS